MEADVTDGLGVGLLMGGGLAMVLGLDTINLVDAHAVFTGRVALTTRLDPVAQILNKYEVAFAVSWTVPAILPEDWLKRRPTGKLPVSFQIYGGPVPPATRLAKE